MNKFVKSCYSKDNRLITTFIIMMLINSVSVFLSFSSTTKKNYPLNYQTDKTWIVFFVGFFSHSRFFCAQLQLYSRNSFYRWRCCMHMCLWHFLSERCSIMWCINPSQGGVSGCSSDTNQNGPLPLLYITLFHRFDSAYIHTSRNDDDKRYLFFFGKNVAICTRSPVTFYVLYLAFICTVKFLSPFLWWICWKLYLNI